MRSWIEPLIACALPTVLYTLTVAPGLTFIDSGELAAVATLLGVAHPTGYPLFTLVGWLAAHVPLGPEPIARLNIMAALFCAVAAVLFYFLNSHLLRQWVKNERAVRAAALGGSLVLAFTGTYWSQATAVEVYSLHLLLLATALLTFFRALYPADGQRRESRWFLFAFTLGLSFSNHMTTILLLPGIIVMYFSAEGMKKRSWIRVARTLPAFLLGLTPYLYLPLRATQNPIFNWGGVSTLERLGWHVGGKQYRVWIFSSSEAAGRHLMAFFESLPAEMAYLGLVLALAGLVSLFISHRRILWGSVIFFVSTVAYAVNYDIHDIDSYFLLAYVVLGFWASAGLAALFSMRGMNLSRFEKWFFLVALLAGLPGALLNYRRVDQNANFLVEDYMSNLMSRLAPNALVLSYQWDFWVSGSYYAQYVRGVRQDVAVVDKELLRRSWYLDELQARMPWLIGGSKSEVDAFRRELWKFEHDRPYSPAAIQGRFEEMIRSFIQRSLESRPVYVTPEVEPEFTKGWQRVPDGLSQRLYADTAFHPTPEPVLRARPAPRSGRLEDATMRQYADAFFTRARYYYTMRGYSEDVNQALKSAISFDPHHQGALSMARILGRSGLRPPS